MEDQAPYSVRELDEKFLHIKEQLTLILEQTKKTNGRVNKLELWKNYIAGGLALATLIILPMCWIIYGDVRTDEDLIKTHIAATK